MHGEWHDAQHADRVAREQADAQMRDGDGVTDERRNSGQVENGGHDQKKQHEQKVQNAMTDGLIFMLAFQLKVASLTPGKGMKRTIAKVRVTRAGGYKNMDLPTGMQS